MIVEAIALTLMMGCAVGLVTTFLLWHHAGLKNLRKFMAQLTDGTAFRMETLLIEDTTTPARAQLSDGTHRVELSVTQQALRELWHVRVPLLRREGRVSFDVVEERFGSQTLQWARNPSEKWAELRGHAWRLHAGLMETARSFLDGKSMGEALSLLMHEDVLMRRCSVTPEALEVEFDRSGLSKLEARRILTLVAQLADVLEDVPIRLRALPPADEKGRLVDHSRAGRPLGIPLTRARN